MTSQPLGEAFIPIRATLDKLDKDLAGARSKVGKAISGVSDQVKKAGKIAIAGVASGVVAIGLGIAAVAGQAIPAASNLNEALNATTVVFGESADIIQDWGKTAADTAGLSEAAFNQIASVTGAMLQNYGLDAESAALATVDLGQRAADMASIFNTDVDDAMTAINAALRGEADPIERFGVSMNAAAVEAHALAIGLADSTGELDQAAMTQARLSLLMQQTDNIAGDFVNTSGDLANAARVQAARWENFMASLGSFALPVITELQTLFMDLAERVFPLIISAMGPIMDIVGAVVSGFVDFIAAIVEGQAPIDAFKQLIFDIATALGMGQVEAALLTIKFQEFIGWVQETAAAIIELLAPIWESVTSFVSFQDVLIALGVVILSVIIPTIVSLVASMLPIILTVGAIIGAVALLRNAWENDWGGIRTNLTAWWNETGKPIFDMLKTWLSENIPKAIQVLKNFWENVLQPAMQAVFTWLSTVLVPFIQDTLIPWLATNLPAAIQALTDFWENTLQPALELVWGFIKDDLVPLFEALWELFNVGGAMALEALAAIWENTLEPALKSVWEFVKDEIIPIFESLLNVFGIDVGPALETFANGPLAVLESAFDSIKSAIQFVTSAVQSLINKLKKLDVPDVFKPGSPTPFELGLLGINKALGNFNKLLDQNDLIGAPSIGLNPALNPAMAMMGADGGSGNVSYVSNTTVNTNQDPLRVLRASRHLDNLAEIPE